MTDQEKLLLLDKVKNYLRITWEEEDDDVASMIDRGIAYFKMRGVDVNFVEQHAAQQLLLDWCRYVRNYRLEDFENNFLSELLNIQLNFVFESEVGESNE